MLISEMSFLKTSTLTKPEAISETNLSYNLKSNFTYSIKLNNNNNN